MTTLEGLGTSTALRKLKASCEFAVQTHASLGPSCAVVDDQAGKLVVWSASQDTHSMPTELAGIIGIKAEGIRVLYLDGSGCYGRNGHEDATTDDALISVMMGKPLRVQWRDSNRQPHAHERGELGKPKSHQRGLGQLPHLALSRRAQGRGGHDQPPRRGGLGRGRAHPHGHSGGHCQRDLRRHGRTLAQHPLHTLPK